MSSLVSRTRNWSTTKMSQFVKPCSRLQHFQFSKNASNFTVAFENLFSDENKRRAQQKLTTEIPVRTSKEYPLKQGYSYAAVLVPMCTVNGEPSLLFTLRSLHLQKHRGQGLISALRLTGADASDFFSQHFFPGGNVDRSDTDVIHTALRETHEELGIDPSIFDVWGQMNPLPGSGGNKVVYPVLARAGEVKVTNLKFNHDEVEEAFHVPLRHLCDQKNIGSTYYCEGPGYILPVYLGAQHRIWGLTAVIVHQMLNIVAPGLYNFKLKYRRRVHEKHLVGKGMKSLWDNKDS